ncbi:MAG: uracil-DNA glycosylase [Deltaproteobacteria bacterium]|nr:uracil-DNA glycosylase [Deltaproteobacteria bacterium]
MHPSDDESPIDPRRELAALASLVRGQLELLGEAGVATIPGATAPRRVPIGVPEEKLRPTPTVAPATAGGDAAAPTLAASAPQVGDRPRGPAALEAVRLDLGDCTRCKLHTHRTKLVFGVGNPEAEILFVGEGPGEDEDKRGEPFVGRAGQLLTRIIEDGMGLERSDVYICNIVKCRPPQNREPERDEIATCLPFLERQIAAVAPKVIVSLGRPSTSTLLGRHVAITALRGKWQEYRGIPLMPTYHPAYVLRQYTADVRRHVWEDMKEVLRRIGREAPAPRRAPSGE